MSISAVCEVCNQIVNFEYDDLPFIHDKCYENCINLRKKIENKITELEIGNNYCYECGIDYQEYTREILNDLLK
jgi:hypoxanthine-guanine phosphoribosyltransferase